VTRRQLAAAIRTVARQLPTEPNVPITTEDQENAQRDVRLFLRAVRSLELEDAPRTRVAGSLLRAHTRLGGGTPNRPGTRLVRSRACLETAARALEKWS
jgi:hypothetical protein